MGTREKQLSCEASPISPQKTKKQNLKKNTKTYRNPQKKKEREKRKKNCKKEKQKQRSYSK